MTPRFKVGDVVCFQIYTKAPDYQQLVWNRGVVVNVETYRSNYRYVIDSRGSNEQTLDVGIQWTLNEDSLFTEEETLLVVLKHGQMVCFDRRAVKDLVQ